MSKKPVKEYEWRITRIKSSPAAYYGTFIATDADSAIKQAIKEFEITNSEHQERLVAQRVG
jgi:hypothetical protein